MHVALGMSGGVDSSVAAALLLEQGHSVTGVFLECWRGPGCRAEEDRKDALDVALSLGIPFEVLDFREAYKQKVVDYFYREYQAGRTPNPDVMCNREIKFGLFYNWAMEKGFDAVATGHYARTDGTHLLQSVDTHKDQTYFLYQLREEQLAHILFPIGHLTKPELRAEAERRKIKVAKKPDSQGICFIGEVSVLQFLKELGMEEKKGEVVNASGEVIGEHKGAWFYTIGQRHGFATKTNQPDSAPLFVVSKDVDTNTLVVGEKNSLYSSEFRVGELHWINDSPKIGDELLLRIRHGGELVEVVSVEQVEQVVQVTLAKPVFGVAPGQAAVFYDGDICLGGGVIVG